MKEASFVLRGRAMKWRKAGDEPRCRLDVRLVVVDSFDEREAEPNLFATQQSHVVQDGLVRHPRQLAVALRVHMLQVDEEEIRLGGNGLHHFGRGIERCVYRAMQTATTQLLQNRQTRLRLHERLTAAQRHAASAVRHHIALLLHLSHQLLQRPLASALLEGSSGTVNRDDSPVFRR